MKIYHVLNGDALAERFNQTGLQGEVAIMRACLIDGGLEGETLPEFLKTRAAYINKTYQGIYTEVTTEIDKITQAPSTSEFNLWFGYDLFCQVNLWFIILSSITFLKE